jgi:methylmalonyl-CoA mutase cobalamin-binding subunit
MAYTHITNPIEDENALRDAYNVGYLLVETIKALKSYGVHIGYKPDVNIRELVELVKDYMSRVNVEKEQRFKLLENLLNK